MRSDELNMGPFSRIMIFCFRLKDHLGLKVGLDERQIILFATWRRACVAGWRVLRGGVWEGGRLVGSVMVGALFADFALLLVGLVVTWRWFGSRRSR